MMTMKKIMKKGGKNNMRLEDRIKYTPRGFSYVEITPSECLSWGGMCVCNGCNGQFLDKNLYLIWALGDVYCKDCFEDFLKDEQNLSQEDVDSDLKYQKEEDLEYYRAHLGR